MNFWNTFAALFSNFGALTWQMVVMWGIGALLIYLAIVKKMEPSLLLPMGFGAILVNLPASGAITQGDTVGPISALFEAGMSNELFPLLLFIGIGAMIDFGPLLEKPWLMLFGAAAQFGIFFTLFLAGFFFDMKDAASIAVIGAADGPTAIFVANTLKSQYLGAIMVAAYSYMALVPIVQPPVIRLLTTQKERRIRMPYEKGNVTQLTKILFPVVVTVVAGLVAPASVALVGFLMFGNLLRECGVLNSLSETAQNVLANLITLLLGLTVAGQMTADKFVRPDTLLIMALGLVAFIFDTAGGVLFAKLLNLFLPEGKKLNPMIGAAGISAFPMSGRVVNKMGLAEDNQNFLLMYSISVNVSGQIASVLAEMGACAAPETRPGVRQAGGVTHVDSKAQYWGGSRAKGSVAVMDVLSPAKGDAASVGYLDWENLSFSWTFRRTEVLVVLEGDLNLSIEGTTFSAAHGDVFSIPAGTEVELSSSGHVRCATVAVAA